MEVFLVIESVSSISYYDSIRLICHFLNSVSNKKTTKNDLIERGYTIEQIKSMEGNGNFNPVVFCGIKIKSDFSYVSYPHFDYVYDLYLAYKNGILPFEGSYSDQPSQITQIFSLLDSMNIEYQNRQIKSQSKSNMVPKNK